MNISLHSDLHVEMRGYDTGYPRIPANADVIALCGDICGECTPEWVATLSSRNPGRHILFVAGNHEFHGKIHADTLEMFRRYFDGHDYVHFLEKDEVVIDGTRFLGATLWTDFMGPDIDEDTREFGVSLLKPEYRRMGVSAYQCFDPEHIKGLHRETVNWLEERLKEEHDGHTVVITHFPPLRECVHGVFGEGARSVYFLNNLEHLMDYKIDAWVYGHNHWNMDVMKGGMRLISNQLGHLGENMPKHAYQEDLIVRLGDHQK